MRYPGNIVTEIDTRSMGAGRPDKCFYCTGVPGGEHDADCVILDRPVKVRLTLDLVVTRPRSWSVEDITSHLNESSWCSGNIMRDIERHYALNTCFCGTAEFQVVGDATLAEAIEAGLLPDSETDVEPVRPDDGKTQA